MIRPATTEDAKAIATIYNHYILHSHATFETEPIDVPEMLSRIRKVQNEFALPWLVKEESGVVVGYAYATQWKPRKAYENTVEISVYLDKDCAGKGYGKHLYQELIRQLQGEGYHAVIGGISLPNESSVKLHESLGFQKVAHFKETGFKFDRWIDVGYWELILTND
ncbi:MAG: arsinothricin resistance N-acetyltransferase ArsN1 [Ekhidna sp.]|uniref:arsinothricin resistance N-acetyltransferase ArsN1 family B n=1 Tax=Ekhidna sp. TaxID=2608089 RepID=UPI0032ECB63C